jgi:hypothetical protein
MWSCPGNIVTQSITRTLEGYNCDVYNTGQQLLKSTDYNFLLDQMDSKYSDNFKDVITVKWTNKQFNVIICVYSSDL